MWEASCISIWMLSQSEMFGVKRSEETQTMQSKSTFQLGFIKSLRRCWGLNKVWRWHIFLVWKLLFIDTNLKSCHYYEAQIPFCTNIFSECFLVIPCSKSVWWKPEVIEMRFFGCQRKKKKNTHHRAMCVSRPAHVCMGNCISVRCLSEMMSIHAAMRANSKSSTTPPPTHPNKSTTLQTHSHFSSHLFIQAVACCFTGTSPCFVLFSPLFVFNCYRGGQLISLPPLSICSPHSCGAVCLLAHLLPSPNATSLQMD